jgi:hypothetical protein
MGLQCNVLMHYHRPMYTINPTDSPLSAFDPAFPLFIPGDGKNPPNAFVGMTRRDYFAAHAPLEIPDWFSFPAFDKHPYIYDFIKSNPVSSAWTEEWSERIVRSITDGITLPERVRVAVGNEALKEFSIAWGKERKRCHILYENWHADRYFAWRYYYADRMLAQGDMK